MDIWKEGLKVISTVLKAEILRPMLFCGRDSKVPLGPSCARDRARAETPVPETVMVLAEEGVRWDVAQCPKGTVHRTPPQATSNLTLGHQACQSAPELANQLLPGTVTRRKER
jgi:hypothetical protein